MRKLLILLSLSFLNGAIIGQVKSDSLQIPEFVRNSFHKQNRGAREIKWFHGNYMVDTASYPYKITFIADSSGYYEGNTLKYPTSQVLYNSKGAEYTTDASFGTDFVPKKVLDTFYNLYPFAWGEQWSYGTGIPVEHGIPDNYFKGKTYCWVTFGQGIRSYNIFFDSVGSILLSEIDESVLYTMPKKILHYLNKRFTNYKIEYDYSSKNFTSLNGNWWFDIFLTAPSEGGEQWIYFDNAGNYVNSDIPETPKKGIKHSKSKIQH